MTGGSWRFRRARHEEAGRESRGTVVASRRIYAPEFEKRWDRFARRVGGSWSEPTSLGDGHGIFIRFRAALGHG
jgi:hypothetical protein